MKTQAYSANSDARTNLLFRSSRSAWCSCKYAAKASIGAASVLAKVSRDRYMLELDKQYPQYQLAKHKGYPTKLHYELIAQYGIQPFYRRSFLKKQGYWPESGK